MYYPKSKSQEELLKFAEALMNDALMIMRKKNHDYSADDDALKNFSMVEFIGVATREQGIYTRLMDKIVRIGNGIKFGENGYAVDDEKFMDSILDAINYLVILAFSHEVRNIGENSEYQYIHTDGSTDET